MDNIKTLLEKHEYELVLKLTTSASKPSDVFYHLTALLGLAKLDDALLYLNEHHEALESAYLPWLMKAHIELLCLSGKFDDAYNKIDYYQNLPYYSQEAEEVLKTLKDVIRKYEKEKGKTLLNEEEIVKLLRSKDNDSVIQGLDALKERNIKPYINAIKNVLKDFPSQSVRSFALLTLVSMGVNFDFDFNHNGQIMKVNPSQLKPPFVDNSFSVICKKMHESYQNPTIYDNALNILSFYLIYIYPETTDLEDDDLVDALNIVASKMLQLEPSLEGNEKINSLAKTIEEALQNF